MVLYQALKDPTQRGLVRAVNESQDAHRVLGFLPPRNTLLNALCFSASATFFNIKMTNTK
jgi:hypothetical protein